MKSPFRIERRSNVFIASWDVVHRPSGCRAGAVFFDRAVAARYVAGLQRLPIDWSVNEPVITPADAVAIKVIRREAEQAPAHRRNA